MNTKDIMEIGLKAAGLEKAPHDTIIMVPGENIKKVLIGIDMSTPELILAKDLGYDCVVSHHPQGGTASTEFSKVMDVQIEKMVEYGVPINKAQKALRKKQASIDLSSHVGNYDRSVSAAELLEMPYLNIHLPADLIGERFVQEYLENEFDNKPKTTLQDIVDSLNELSVYKDALASPVIRVGGPKDYAGKIVVLFAGGTNGGTDVYKSYFDAGVGTIICMHVPEDVKKAVAEQNIGNVIVAGHMASDTIGLNEIIKAFEQNGLEVTKMSGIL